MIVTQRKRIVHDEVGNLCKVDILQSVRRKDAPATLIADPEEKTMNALSNSTQQQSHTFVKYLCLLGLFLLVFTFYSGYYKSSSLKGPSQFERVVDLAGLSKKQVSLSELLETSQLGEKWDKKTQSKFLESTKCTKDTQGSISCQFNFTKVITNDSSY